MNRFPPTPIIVRCASSKQIVMTRLRRWTRESSGSVAVATLLIEGGADPKALCEEYGGEGLDVVREWVRREKNCG